MEEKIMAIKIIGLIIAACAVLLFIILKNTIKI